MTATDTTKDIRSDLAAWIRRWHAEAVDDDAIDQCLQRVAEQHGPQVVANAYYDVVRLLWLDIGQASASATGRQRLVIYSETMPCMIEVRNLRERNIFRTLKRTALGACSKQQRRQETDGQQNKTSSDG